MKYFTRLPSPLLKDLVRYYYQVSGFSSKEEPFQDFTLPNGMQSVVFHFEDPIHVSNVAYDGKRIPRFYLFGAYTQPVFVEHAFGKVDVFGIVFHPGKLASVVPFPLQETTDILLEASDGFGRLINEVLEEMHSRPSFQVRVELIESFLAEKIRNCNVSVSLTDEVLRDIQQQNGNIKVWELARKYRISRQHLNRLFLPRVGLNIKEYARTIRFNRALHAIATDRYTDLMQAVVDFGYHDESHLIKDFHHYTKGRPSDFLKQDNELAKFLLYR